MSNEGAHIEGENIDPAGSSKAKLSDWQQQGLQVQFSKSLEHLTQRDRLNTTHRLHRKPADRVSEQTNTAEGCMYSGCAEYICTHHTPICIYTDYVLRQNRHGTPAIAPVLQLT